MTPSLVLPGDDERLETDVVLAGGHLMEAGRMEPADELIRATVVRVELGELAHQVVGDAIGLHTRGNEDATRSQVVVAVLVELDEHVVIEEFAKSGRSNDVEVWREVRGVERIALREDETLARPDELAREAERRRVEIEAEKCRAREDRREIGGEAARRGREV